MNSNTNPIITTANNNQTQQTTVALVCLATSPVVGICLAIAVHNFFSLVLATFVTAAMVLV